MDAQDLLKDVEESNHGLKNSGAIDKPQSLQSFYTSCSKCGKLMNLQDFIVTIKITNETFLFWCEHCTSKHLNSSGVSN